MHHVGVTALPPAYLEPVCNDGESEVKKVAEVHQLVCLLPRPPGSIALRPKELLVLIVGVAKYLGLNGPTRCHNVWNVKKLDKAWPLERKKP